MIRLLLTLLPFLLIADPAAAGPVAGAVMAVSSIGIGSTTIGSIVGNMVASVAMSALARALGGKRRSSSSSGGLRTSSTVAGGTTPQTIIVGRYATGGCLIAPPYTHGIRGDGDQVEHLVIPYNLADYPIDGVESVIIDGQACTFDTTSGRDGGIYGNTVESGHDYHDRAFLRWHDGRQYSADEMLTEVYGSHAERPWKSSAILTRTAYAALTFKFDPEVWSGIPQARFVLRGARLYDPRQDSTVGGSGDQRWDDESTWTWTDNPAVIVYNILRGIKLFDDQSGFPVIFGLRVAADKLPLANWTTAMTACDEEVAVAGGGTRPRYRAGLEFAVSDEPLSVIEALADTCGAEIAQTGGVWRIQVGAPAAVSAYLTDDDLMLDGQDDLTPFARLHELFNAAHASFPHPDRQWESAEATPYYREDLEAIDGGRRLVADLDLSAVTDPRQVRALMREFVRDSRRGEVATITVPPALLYLRPLQTISWSSERHGFENWLFEIRSKTIDPMTLCSTLTIRRRDPGVYVEDADGDGQQPATPSTGSGDPVREGVPGFAVEGIDSDGPAVQIEWDAETVGSRLHYQVRVQATGLVIADTRVDLDLGHVIVPGLLRDTGYEARARVIGGRKSVWGDWETATTPDVSGGAGGVGLIDDRLEAEDGDLTLAAETSAGNVIFAGGDTEFARVKSTGLSFTAANPRIETATGEVSLGSASGSYARIRNGSLTVAWFGDDTTVRAHVGEVDIRAGSGSQVRFRHGSASIAVVNSAGVSFLSGAPNPIVSAGSGDLTLAAASGSVRQVIFAAGTNVVASVRDLGLTLSGSTNPRITAATGELDLRAADGSQVRFRTGTTSRAAISATAITPTADNVLSAGDAATRFTQVYAATATINTSDAREKQDVGAIDDAVLDAWAAVQWRSFRFIDAVAGKGPAARLHFGVIAQEIESVFVAAGLDAFALGILCYDEWPEQAEELDPETGEVLEPYRPAGNRYGVRYEEALALEAALMRRRSDALEARLAALEAAA